MDSSPTWRAGDTVEPLGELPPGIQEVWAAGHVGVVITVDPAPPTDAWLTVRVLDTTVRVLGRYLRRVDRVPGQW